MNHDDFAGSPSVEIVYSLKSVVGRRVEVAPNYGITSLTRFVIAFSGAQGTIVGHTPIMEGLTEYFATWYFTPDDGPGMVIPIDPLDVKFIDEEV